MEYETYVFDKDTRMHEHRVIKSGTQKLVTLSHAQKNKYVDVAGGMHRPTDEHANSAQHINNICIGYASATTRKENEQTFKFQSRQGNT